jgi:hypothetical protein
LMTSLLAAPMMVIPGDGSPAVSEATFTVVAGCEFQTRRNTSGTPGLIKLVARFSPRPVPGHREVREDKCDKLRLGVLNGNRSCSGAFRHIAHPEMASLEG